MNNKAVQRYQVFHHKGHTYLIDIEEMSAKLLNETSFPGPNDEDGGFYPVPGQAFPAPAIEAPPIIHMSLFLTQSCNLKCTYCYGEGGEYGARGDMDEKTAFQAVDWLIKQSADMKTIKIKFFGGEPFLKFPLMKRIVAYAKKKSAEVGKKVMFNATTNATLLNDEVIAFLKEESISLLVSFDGPKELQDKQRPFANGEGSYDIILPNIKRLLEAVPDTLSNSVAVDGANHQKIKEAMHDIGFKEVGIIPVSPLLDDHNKNEALTRNIQCTFEDIEQDAEEWLSLIHRRDSEALKDLGKSSELRRGISDLLNNRKEYFFCGAGLGVVAVAVTGDIYFCHRFVGTEEYKIGNIFENGLNRNRYLHSPALENETCVSCFARYYCAGGCKYDNASSRGSITTPPDDICELYRRRLEMAAYIVSNLTREDRIFLAEQDIFQFKPCPLDF